MNKGIFFWFNAAIIGYLTCEKTAKYLEYNLLQNLLRKICIVVSDINWPLSTVVQISKFHIAESNM
jgi:hypothetical protein